MRLLTSRSFFRDPVGYARERPDDVVEIFSPTGRACLVRRPDHVWRVLVVDAQRYGQGKWKRRARRDVSEPVRCAATDTDPARGRLQRALERPLTDHVGRAFEGLARAIAIRRLRAHHGGAVPAHVMSELDRGRGLRFHRKDNETKVPLRYERRRTEVVARLSELERRPSPSAAGRNS